jgi:hypothetical protein
MTEMHPSARVLVRAADTWEQLPVSAFVERLEGVPWNTILHVRRSQHMQNLEGEIGKQAQPIERIPSYYTLIRSAGSSEGKPCNPHRQVRYLGHTYSSNGTVYSIHNDILNNRSALPSKLSAGPRQRQIYNKKTRPSSPNLSETWYQAQPNLITHSLYNRGKQ